MFLHWVYNSINEIGLPPPLGRRADRDPIKTLHILFANIIKHTVNACLLSHQKEKKPRPEDFVNLPPKPKKRELNICLSYFWKIKKESTCTQLRNIDRIRFFPGQILFLTYKAQQNARLCFQMINILFSLWGKKGSTGLAWEGVYREMKRITPGVPPGMGWYKHHEV